MIAGMSLVCPPATLRMPSSLRCVQKQVGAFQGLTIRISNDTSRSSVARYATGGRAFSARSDHENPAGVCNRRDVALLCWHSPIITSTRLEGPYINGGWYCGEFKATSASGWTYTHIIAHGRPHEPNAHFTLERFEYGAMMDGKGAGPIPNAH